MTKLTTPLATLLGFALIALSIASIPYLIKPAHAAWDTSDSLQFSSLTLAMMGIEMNLGNIASSINNAAESCKTY